MMWFILDSTNSLYEQSWLIAAIYSTSRQSDPQRAVIEKRELMLMASCREKPKYLDQTETGSNSHTKTPDVSALQSKLNFFKRF